MSRIVDIEPVITKLENTQKQNVHIFSKRELVDAIADIMNLKPIDAVPVVRCKDCKYAYMTDDGYCNWCDIMADLLGLDYDDIHLPGDWFCADGKKVMDNEYSR